MSYRSLDGFGEFNHDIGHSGEDGFLYPPRFLFLTFSSSLCLPFSPSISLPPDSLSLSPPLSTSLPHSPSPFVISLLPLSLSLSLPPLSHLSSVPLTPWKDEENTAQEREMEKEKERSRAVREGDGISKQSFTGVFLATISLSV
jgi:hypothetical protein